MEENIKAMLQRKKWAVIGATQNTDKYGYKITKKLHDFGYDVYPVNPKYDQVNGLKCYNSIEELYDIVDCISVVVPPKLSNPLTQQIIESPINNIWYQPGTFDGDILDLIEPTNMTFVYYNCVLVELDKHSQYMK